MTRVISHMTLTVVGTILVVIYTILITCSDALTKYLAQNYHAPQLLCMVALMIALLSLGTGRIAKSSGRGSLRTSCPRVMAARAVLTVIATVMFFIALADLVFAQVFLFIALIPLFAALMSGPILGEPVRPSAWIALGCGFAGVVFMIKIDLSGLTLGHLCAFGGAVSGTASIVLARYIGRYEDNALAQVFYPQVAVFLSMAILAPIGWQSMPLFDLLMVAACAVVLFTARFLLVVALRHLTAYAVAPLMNLQFIWMVLIGVVFFNEIPDFSTFFGALIVMASGVYLIIDQTKTSLKPVDLAARGPGFYKSTLRRAATG